MSRKQYCIHWISSPIILVRPTELSSSPAPEHQAFQYGKNDLFRTVHNYQFTQLFLVSQFTTLVIKVGIGVILRQCAPQKGCSTTIQEAFTPYQVRRMPRALLHNRQPQLPAKAHLRCLVFCHLSLTSFIRNGHLSSWLLPHFVFYFYFSMYRSLLSIRLLFPHFSSHFTPESLKAIHRPPQGPD